MEKQKKWQFFLIIGVVFLTIYNILPTLFYYTKPLKSPVVETQALKIAGDIGERVNHLEQEALSWINSFCDLLNLNPLSVKINEQDPQLIHVQFKSVEEAGRLRKFLPRAGNLIGFAPSQLSLYDQESATKTVVIERRIPLHFQKKEIASYFQYGVKKDSKGMFSDLYQGLVSDRVVQIGSSLTGSSSEGLQIQRALANLNEVQGRESLVDLSQNLLAFVKIFEENSAISKRYYASFSRVEGVDPASFIADFISALEHVKTQIRLERIQLSKEKENVEYLEVAQEQRLDVLVAKEATLTNAESLVRRHERIFSQGSTPWTYANVADNFNKEKETLDSGQVLPYFLSLEGRHPFIESIQVDWAKEKIFLKPYADFLKAKEGLSQLVLKEMADQVLYNQMAFISHAAGEMIKPEAESFSIALSQTPGTESFLAFRLFTVASQEVKHLSELLKSSWIPKHPDLQRAVFPIWDYETYQALPLSERQMGLLIYAPALYNKMPLKGFKMNSIYIIAKGVDKILQRVQGSPESEGAKQFLEDFGQLQHLMQNSGFFGYSAGAMAASKEFAGDFIFEGEDYFQTLLKATRENFTVHGTKRYAVLEFVNVEERILTENKIGNEIHENLLKWRDDYRAAQVGARGISKYDVPAPTQNVFLSNCLLSLKKYFRGDDRKILHWGLDMSGGKTVQIELRDSSGKVVTNEADIRQGINELYSRVNKMGVSEVSIRQEGNTIALDFPGSQTLSATDLVKASSMYFHVVNEKFMTNPSLADSTQRFLQEVWNEAVITNRKSSEEIQTIAWKHLYGSLVSTDKIQPRSAASKMLYDRGLRLANPQETGSVTLLDETFSKIAILRGDDFRSWYGQSHPLLIVFNNYALEGSNLENVHASYDPSKGNFLAFGVRGSYTGKEGQKKTPRDDLQAWTSKYAKEKIGGSSLEVDSQGRGFRMAVILNGTVVTAPALESALRESASITGSFTQREVNQLEADLKAGSLSFTPRILSEKSVSPELGAKERTQGIVATISALSLAILTMVVYYRFAGVVASVAVLFNLLIMWAALQNIGATLSLAGIAAVVLAVAMAVDANVLVFERIREEFAISGRIASAVHAGYRKAFSAIFDSNITTLIAALILLNFDAGPIRSFAVNLIIGIASSLFSSLFMTHFFFGKWVQNPKNKELKMANFIKSANFDFLKFTKPTVIVSLCVILVGGGLLLMSRQTVLGMDFTGGYALNLELKETPKGNYRLKVEEALLKKGVLPQEIQVRELEPSNHIRIFLAESLEKSGHPFYGMPLEQEGRNPKIAWVVKALQDSGCAISPTSLQTLEQNWTAISGQMSETMRLNALVGIALALACILVYITVRFEFKYAISATLCLAHDVFFCLGAIALMNRLGIAVQIDLHTVAALMTIVGYSLNDTIIVFDRIREDIKLMHKRPLSEVINHALNVTLSRTLMTSGITLLVLIPLIILGGSTLFGFALVMGVGVVFGTLSSLFIAAPLMQYFHRREMRRHEKLALNEH